MPTAWYVTPEAVVAVPPLAQTASETSCGSLNRSNATSGRLAERVATWFQKTLDLGSGIGLRPPVWQVGALHCRSRTASMPSLLIHFTAWSTMAGVAGSYVGQPGSHTCCPSVMRTTLPPHALIRSMSYCVRLSGAEL